MRRRERLVYEPVETREDAQALCRMFASLLLQLGLTAVYGVRVKRTAGRWGVFVGRHDDGKMSDSREDLPGLANQP